MLEVKAKMLATQSQAVAEERRSNAATISAKQVRAFSIGSKRLTAYESRRCHGQLNQKDAIASAKATAWHSLTHAPLHPYSTRTYTPMSAHSGVQTLATAKALAAEALIAFFNVFCRLRLTS